MVLLDQCKNEQQPPSRVISVGRKGGYLGKNLRTVVRNGAKVVPPSAWKKLYKTGASLGWTMGLEPTTYWHSLACLVLTLYKSEI